MLLLKLSFQKRLDRILLQPKIFLSFQFQKGTFHTQLPIHVFSALLAPTPAVTRLSKAHSPSLLSFLVQALP